MSQHKRIILVSAMGTSPAVLTNMVWGLAHQKHSIVPDEIVVFITKSGKELLIQKLFDEGVWNEMRSNLKREKIEIDGKLVFGATSIRVIPDADGNEIEDLRTGDDNLRAADFMLSQLRQYTEDSETELHVSIAGGRKTISALLFSCMTLLGRECDKVYHVLLPQELEQGSTPEFFYPEPGKTFVSNGTAKKLKAKQIKTELFEVPFVRMRGWYQEKFKAIPPNYTTLVSKIQTVAPRAIAYPELAVYRLLEHCGWENLQYVGESGDMGADILGVRYNQKTGEYESYLFQVKAVSGDNYIGTAAVDQAVQGQGFYGCKIAVVVTNGEFRKAAYTRKDELNRLHFNVKLWNGVFLSQLLSKFPEASSKLKRPHEYQNTIIDKVIKTYNDGGKKALYIVATGMGKTIIASTIANRLYSAGLKKILVVCHSIPLAMQLQKSFWSQIGKSMKTRLFMDGKIPVPIDGINFGLYQTLYNNLGGLQPGVFDLIIVDEAHHARANAFEVCLNHLKPRFLIGMTATPWRSDGLALEQMFGVPLAKVSLVDGMRLGYLSKVDYRLMCDNINWSEVSKMSKKKISVRDLNKRLFIPQRDDAIISDVMKVARGMQRPKIAVFSPSVAHAESFAKLLNIAGIPTGCVTSKDKQNAHKTLLEFSSDKLSAITAVDILNEGIDVPDINVLVFLRATHSRRIFVQQLGRGLRTSKFKDKVIVLDFVTDIRRIALVKAFNDETKAPRVPGDVSTVYLKDGVVTFNDTKSQRFIDAWLNDVASLEDRDDAEKLEFPDITEV